MPSRSRSTASCIITRFAGLNDRIVASNTASSGMMFSFVPAANLPTVTTTGSLMSSVGSPASAAPVTISQATGIGSRVRCGAEPCPPTPTTRSDELVRGRHQGPGREDQVPRVARTPSRAGSTPRRHGRPPRRADPRRSSPCAPAVVSSAGCAHEHHVARQLVSALVQQPRGTDEGRRRGGRARRRASDRRARRSRARPVSSVRGSASMSPRSRHDRSRAVWAPPRSTAVTELRRVAGRDLEVQALERSQHQRLRLGQVAVELRDAVQLSTQVDQLGGDRAGSVERGLHGAIVSARADLSSVRSAVAGRRATHASIDTWVVLIATERRRRRAPTGFAQDQQISSVALPAHRKVPPVLRRLRRPAAAPPRRPAARPRARCLWQ